jgi:hypothetical protein
LSGVEGSQSDWQLYSTNSGNTGTRLRVTADGNATFAGTVSSGAITSTGYITGTRLRAGDGTDGYFYSDTAGRTAFNGGDFYIQDGVSNYYNYATNQYYGGTSGDSLRFRSNVLTGDNWGIPASGTITSTGIRTGTAQGRVKLGVWSDTNYGIGMQTGYTFGGINNNYAMTFQMNNDNARGFWWGDAVHTNAQGAMSLTTHGYLTVANRVRIGYGESDTTTPTIGLEVSGKAGFVAAGNSNRGNIIMGPTGSGTSKWAALAATHYNDATGSGNASGAAGCMVIGNFSDNTMNRVYIGGGPYELNPATEIRFHTHTATTHNTGGSQAMIIDTNGNLLLNNDLHIDEYIYHAGDTNTYIRALEDSFTFRTGGGDRLILNNTLNYSQVPLEIKCEGGNAATDGGRFLSVAYSGSNRIATMSSQYSSGNLCIGNGLAYDQGNTAFVSTFGNFSRPRTGILVNGGSITMVGTSGAQQTAVDSVVTAPTRHTFNTQNGDYTASGNVTAYSDERLKTNIQTLDSKKALQMRGVSFTKDGQEGSGVIAQEIEKIAPELVMTADDEMGTKSVAYGNLVGYLIENAKDQQKQIDELKQEVSSLRSKI